MNKKEWLSLNPLKIWMKSEEWTITDVARHFGVSYFTVWQYLQGLIPDTRKKEWFFSELIGLTGNEDIQDDWYEWEVSWER